MLKPIFGPHTRAVFQFLINLRNLSPADIDVVTSTWTKVNPVDRALAWAHLVTAAKQEYPVTATTSAARRGAIDTARLLGRKQLGILGRSQRSAARFRVAGHLQDTCLVALRAVVVIPLMTLLSVGRRR
jgi:hypothetical protein